MVIVENLISINPEINQNIISCHQHSNQFNDKYVLIATDRTDTQSSVTSMWEETLNTYMKSILTLNTFH